MNFQNSLVCFIDILGFKNILNEQDFAQKIQNYFNIIDESINKSIQPGAHGIYPNESITYSAISDSIILSIPFGTGDWMYRVKVLRYFLSSIEKIQFKCALEGIWMRGGISQGLLSHDQNNIVGKAFVNAYQLEHQAIYPRIIIDTDVILETFKGSNNDTRNQFLTQVNQTYGNPNYSGTFLFDWQKYPSNGIFTEDTPFFIHYMSPLLKQDNTEFREKIFKNLKTGIYSSNSNIYLKYKWVIEYIKNIMDSSTKDDFIENYYKNLSNL